MNKMFAGFYGALVALVVSVVFDFMKSSLNWSPVASIICSSYMGLVLLFVYEVCRSVYVKTNKAKESPIHNFTGTWKINIHGNKDRPSSLCRIYFSGGEFVYDGQGMNNDGTIGSEWTSRFLHYATTTGELSFSADATIYTESGFTTLMNYGKIKFIQNSKNGFTHGTGVYVDSSNSSKQEKMFLTKISHEEYDKMIQNVIPLQKNKGDWVRPAHLTN